MNHNFIPNLNVCAVCGCPQEKHFDKCEKCGMIFTDGLIHKCENEDKVKTKKKTKTG